MKKLLTAVVALYFVLFSPVFSFAETSNLVTQLKVFDTDTTYRYYYFYDNNSNKVLEIKYFLQESQWKRLTHTEWVYNDNKCVTQRVKIFKNADWVNNYEINYTYEDGLMISEKHIKFINNMEVDYKLITMGYENGLMTLRREFIYDTNKWLLTQITENTYQNDKPESTIIKKIGQSIAENQDFKLTSEYNESGLMISQTLGFKNAVNEWDNQHQTVWFYTSDSKISTQRSKIWNTELSKWENASMSEYAYNLDGKIATETYYFWKTMFWERSLKFNYQYDGDGILTRKVLQMPIFRQWRDFSSIDYSNFTNNKANLMETKLSFWGNNGSLLSTNIPFAFNDETEIKTGNQIIISYDKIDNTDISTYSMNNDFSIQVYPNPSEDVFYFNPDEYNIQSWTVYDLNGKVIKQSAMTEKSGVIDLSNVTEGIYLLRVVTTNEVLSQKLIRK